VRVISRLFFTAPDGLEVVAVEVKGVFSRVVVIQNDLDDFVVAEDEGVGVDAVDAGVGRVGACG
jgi:hypothetical protein